MDNYKEIIGFVAAFLPQVYKTWKTKDVSGLSLPMLLMFFMGVLGWLIYGVLKHSPSLIFAYAITALSTFMLVFFKLKYNKK